MSETLTKKEVGRASKEQLASAVADALGMSETGEEADILPPLEPGQQPGTQGVPLKVRQAVGRVFTAKDATLRKEGEGLYVLNAHPYEIMRHRPEDPRPVGGDGFKITTVLRKYETHRHGESEKILMTCYRPKEERTEDGDIIPDPAFAGASRMWDSRDFFEKFQEDIELTRLQFLYEAQQWADRVSNGSYGGKDFGLPPRQ